MISNQPHACFKCTPVVRSKFLTIYIDEKRDLDIKGLKIQHLSITIKNDVNNLSITSCGNLETVAISAKHLTKPTIKELSVSDLPAIYDLRLYSLTGKNAIPTGGQQEQKMYLEKVLYTYKAICFARCAILVLVGVFCLRKEGGGCRFYIFQRATK